MVTLNRMKNHSENENQRQLVPVTNKDAANGMDSVNQISIYEPDHFEDEIPFEEAQNGDIAIWVSGTSMHPTYPNGSAVLLRKVEYWYEFFGYGNVYYIALTDGRRILKEVQKSLKDPKNYVLCVSHNPKVAPEELPIRMIAGIWRVMGMAREEGA